MPAPDDIVQISPDFATRQLGGSLLVVIAADDHSIYGAAPEFGPGVYFRVPLDAVALIGRLHWPSSYQTDALKDHQGQMPGESDVVT